MYIAECVSEFFLIGEYLAKLQARVWLSHALCVPANTQLKDQESARDNHVFASNLAPPWEYVKPGCELSSVQILQNVDNEKTFNLNGVKFTPLALHYNVHKVQVSVAEWLARLTLWCCHNDRSHCESSPVHLMNVH